MHAGSRVPTAPQRPLHMFPAAQGRAVHTLPLRSVAARCDSTAGDCSV